MTDNQKFKRAKAAYKAYKSSDMPSLYKAYSKPSAAKLSAWQDCYRLMICLNGFGLKVISKTCQIFTCGFCYRDPVSYELRFVYITPSYRVDVGVEE